MRSQGRCPSLMSPGSHQASCLARGREGGHYGSEDGAQNWSGNRVRVPALLHVPALGLGPILHLSSFPFLQNVDNNTYRLGSGLKALRCFIESKMQFCAF